MERVEMTKEQALDFIIESSFDFNKSDKEVSEASLHALNRVMGRLMAVLDSRHSSEKEKTLAINLADLLQDSLKNILVKR